MSMHTRCTHCEAVFRVTLLQLQSSSGRVRCGVCSEVFDAFVHLRAADPPLPEPAQSPEPLPQIDVPSEIPDGEVDVRDTAAIAEEPAPLEAPHPDAAHDVPEAVGHWSAENDGQAGTSTALPADTDEFVIEDITESAPSPGSPYTAAAEDAPGETDGWPSAEEGESTPLDAFHDAVDKGAPIESDPLAPAFTTAAPTARRRRWPVVAGVSAALLVLAGQATYQFRTPIATALPALRPTLESACAIAGCSVPLPRLPERLMIETSDLRALDPSRPHRVVLATTVRNAAPVTQAYPILELSLTDARDKLTARKVFSPQEYLETPPAKGAGLGADAEFSVRMQIDIGDIEASGYRIYLFHR